VRRAKLTLKQSLNVAVDQSEPGFLCRRHPAAWMDCLPELLPTSNRYLLEVRHHTTMSDAIQPVVEHLDAFVGASDNFREIPLRPLCRRLWHGRK
jgi:hypothetical protein